jgi:hypothetical protein
VTALSLFFKGPFVEKLRDVPDVPESFDEGVASETNPIIPIQNNESDGSHSI